MRAVCTRAALNAWHCCSLGRNAFNENLFGSPQIRHISQSFARKADDNEPDDGKVIVDFPSDLKDEEERKRLNRRKDQSRKSFRPPEVDPAMTTVLMFPGQGSQFVGMGKQLIDNNQCRELYEEASSILKYHLLKVCLEGPEEKLNRTSVCQPAVLVTSLAALTHLRSTQPEVLESCVGALGFSVGEYTALVMAGCLSFQDAVSVIAARGLAMESACDLVQSGLATVFLSHRSRLGEACETARMFCVNRLGIDDPVLAISTYLMVGVKVIGGHKQALDFLTANQKEFDIKRIKPIKVSGAFHTPLMRPAIEDLKTALKQVEIKSPVIPVHSNVDAALHRKPEKIKSALIKQLVRAVKWEQILHTVYQRDSETNYPRTYEVGPGSQLGVTLRDVNKKAFNHYHKIEV